MFISLSVISPSPSSSPFYPSIQTSLFEERGSLWEDKDRYNGEISELLDIIIEIKNSSTISEMESQLLNEESKSNKGRREKNLTNSNNSNSSSSSSYKNYINLLTLKPPLIPFRSLKYSNFTNQQSDGRNDEISDLPSSLPITQYSSYLSHLSTTEGREDRVWSVFFHFSSYQDVYYPKSIKSLSLSPTTSNTISNLSDEKVKLFLKHFLSCYDSYQSNINFLFHILSNLFFKFFGPFFYQYSFTISFVTFFL